VPFKTYIGGTTTGAWQTISTTQRVFAPVTGLSAYRNGPQLIDDYYYAKVTNFSDTFVDYYVTASDTQGNIVNSPIQHVYVAPNANPTPTPAPHTNADT